MKRNLSLAAALLAITGAASAQSTVTLFGLVDIGVARESGGPAGSVTKVDGSGIHSGNRWGLRGTEDLGGGLSALFVLESGFNSDTGTSAQGGLLFGRQAFAGLRGGFGTLTAGRQYSLHWAAIDAFDPLDGLTGGTHNLLRRTVRTNNTLVYSTPSMGGATAQLSYAPGEVAGNSSASRVLGASFGYAGGPLGVRLAHHNARNATGTDTTRDTFLGGSYNFGVAKAFAGYQIEKGLAGADQNAAMVGAQVPLGAATLMASFIRKDDKSTANNDARQFGLAATYALSKRTNLYTSWVRIDNERTLVYRTKTGDGTGDREVNLGIRHRF